MKLSEINQACIELGHVLRAVNVSSTIGHSRGVLVVFVDVLAEDAPKVPAEFNGYRTLVRQDPNPAPPLMHKKVGEGCAHCRWDLIEYKRSGKAPNPACELTQRTATASAPH